VQPLREIFARDFGLQQQSRPSDLPSLRTSSSKFKRAQTRGEAIFPREANSGVFQRNRRSADIAGGRPIGAESAIARGTSTTTGVGATASLDNELLRVEPIKGKPSYNANRTRGQDDRVGRSFNRFRRWIRSWRARGVGSSKSGRRRNPSTRTGAFYPACLTAISSPIRGCGR
jgi:hypothetical protein